MIMKINVAELLKDCPKGMELDCAMYETVTLNRVLDGLAYPIRIETPDGLVLLNEYGCYSRNKHAKCIIFPKGKTTWEGFVPPCKFKEGDVVISIYGDIHLLRTENSSYCSYRHSRETKLDPMLTTSIAVVRLATEEEKEKLFKAIKEHGYKWNAETKTLEKLVEPIENKEINNFNVLPGLYKCVHRMFDGTPDGKLLFEIGNIYKCLSKHDRAEFEVSYGHSVYLEDPVVCKHFIPFEPKFKVGDRIRLKENHNYIHTITGIREEENKYAYGVTFVLKFSEQDNWELVPNKFDINTLIPFESRVLVRNADGDLWKPAVYGFSHSKGHYVVGGVYWGRCIPYEDNEHLRGTTNDCDDFYKTWE